MTETEFQIVKSVGFVAAIAVSAGLQHVRPHSGAGGSWRTNGVLWGVDAAVLGAVCAGCACAAAVWAEHAGLGLLNALAAPAWVGIPVTLVALDLVSWAWHRANHRFTPLWRFHQVHHSDPRFTATTALRFHPGELLLALPVRLAAVVLVGASVLDVIVFEVLFALATFVEHGDIALPRRLEGRLARVLVTPALHRRHHARLREARDSNYGTVFSVWDRAFGTFGGGDSAARVDIGLPDVEGSPGAWDALEMPLRVYGRLRSP